MIKIKIQNFTYTLLQNRDDVTSMILHHNLFGFNNRIYTNLYSQSIIESKDNEKYLQRFSKEELRYKLFNFLYPVEICTQTHDDDYDTIKNINFADLYNFIKNEGKNYDTIHASLDDTEESIPIPLGSDILFNSSNYAYQEIEKIKLEGLMDLGELVHVNEFLKIF